MKNSAVSNGFHKFNNNRSKCHAPRELARVMRFYLKRGGHISVEVKGKRINRGLGYGLEIPADYKFTGNYSDTSKLKTLLKKK